ncbi:hypothetical protein [Catellatospora methionotrophica]|uniref:hypothetical protein n=1 Tax=Catellatospora methionotrophica TaxID=121620 RepID=UPI0033C96C1A
MSFSWPRSDGSTPLDEGRSWTAEFDRYDQQRRDDIYYIVSVRRHGRMVGRFMAQVALVGGLDDWTDGAFDGQLRSGLHQVAGSGVANTGHHGPIWQPLDMDDLPSSRMSHAAGP